MNMTRKVELLLSKKDTPNYQRLSQLTQVRAALVRNKSRDEDVQVMLRVGNSFLFLAHATYGSSQTDNPKFVDDTYEFIRYLEPNESVIIYGTDTGGK